MKSKIVVVGPCVINGVSHAPGTVLGMVDRGAKRNCPVTSGRIEVLPQARAQGVTPGHLDARLSSRECVVSDGSEPRSDAAQAAPPREDMPPPPEVPDADAAPGAKKKKSKKKSKSAQQTPSQ